MQNTLPARFALLSEAFIIRASLFVPTAALSIFP